MNCSCLRPIGQMGQCLKEPLGTAISRCRSGAQPWKSEPHKIRRAFCKPKGLKPWAYLGPFFPILEKSDNEGILSLLVESSVLCLFFQECFNIEKKKGRIRSFLCALRISSKGPLHPGCLGHSGTYNMSRCPSFWFADIATFFGCRISCWCLLWSHVRFEGGSWST